MSPLALIISVQQTAAPNRRHNRRKGKSDHPANGASHGLSGAKGKKTSFGKVVTIGRSSGRAEVLRPGGPARLAYNLYIIVRTGY